ncbi:hypothetical protein Q73_13595 [Bacillus coahuilensis m2-6]|uniref:hypothetical protein n=1 Tax=Bacillus coahuilensis TaxID=408580 RepID=UPI0001850A23|nr:hypothetical protein [Bacillus coahuilensis]KUP05111.1 hypothetical protein Q73_13595 [Bacillus coahuilensis m2-6]
MLDSMMEEQVLALGKDLHKILPYKDEQNDKLVSQGLRLFQQRSVYGVKASRTEIQAQVQDVVPVKVKLDLDFPMLSRCSCPRDGWCRHRMAVYFYMYEKLGNVNEWYGMWRNGGKLPEDDSAGSKPDLTKLHPSLKRASDLMKTRTDQNRTPEGWYSILATRFEEELDLDELAKRSYMLDMMVNRAYRSLLKDAPLEREWKALYQLYTALFLYEHLGGWLVDYDMSEQSIESILQFLLDEMSESLLSLGVTAIPFAFDPFLDFIREKLIDMISSEQIGQLAIELYQYLWINLFKKKALREKEYDRLMDRLKAQEPMYAGERVAIIHQLLLLGENEKAQMLLEKEASWVLLPSETWIRYFFQYQQPEQAVVVLQGIKAKLPEFLNGLGNDYQRSDFSRWFLRQVENDYMIEREPGLLKNLYQYLLPYSYYNLSRLLFTEEDYHEWVELQQHLGYELGELEYLGLKELSKERPDLALPLYHHGIEKLIQNKNRDSYKQAVRYLKKLRTLYKKLKKPERFDQYMMILLDDTKRLRAFQEEVQRGNLVHA